MLQSWKREIRSQERKANEQIINGKLKFNIIFYRHFFRDQSAPSGKEYYLLKTDWNKRTSEIE